MTDLSVYEIAALVGRSFETAGIDYMMTGSMVSGLQGHPRTTNDIDFVVMLTPVAIPKLIEALGEDFDVDEIALAEAAARRSSWNIFHSPTVTRIDLFVLKNDPYQHEALRRRMRWEVLPGAPIFVISPEDTVLQKLLWFRAAGETSERQFRDVVDVIRVQGDALNDTYLQEWAIELGLSELLAKARAEGMVLLGN